MVMPSSGPISMAQAHAEFGLGYNLSAYYGCDSGVPTSGAISLGHLYGKKRRTAYDRYCLVFNNTSVGTGSFYIGEIEFREIENGAKMGVDQLYCSASNAAPWFDGQIFTATNSSGYIDQYASVTTRGGARVLRQVAIYVSNGSSGPRNVKVYGGNGFTTSPNPPTMTNWTLLQEFNRPAHVWNGWSTFEI